MGNREQKNRKNKPKLKVKNKIENTSIKTNEIFCIYNKIRKEPMNLLHNFNENINHDNSYIEAKKKY